MPAVSLEHRKHAAMLAAQKWIEQCGNQSQASVRANAMGVKLSQQVIGWAAKGEKIGLVTIDRLAALYETTPDGLVSLFVGAGGGIALRDVPGFARALAEAKEQRGSKVEPWVWLALGDVVLPSRPRDATPDMVIDMAHFIDRWCATSGVRAVIVDILRG